MKRAAFAGVIAVAMAVAFSPAFDREAEGQAPYRARRTPDGKPDLQGIWRVMNSANVNIQDHSAGSMGSAGHGVVVGNDDPYATCLLPGVPRATYVGLPFQIVQTPGFVAIAYEYVHAARMVSTNGTPHQEDVEWWMGDARGKWEGETLVVDVTNFKDATWFDMAGIATALNDPGKPWQHGADESFNGKLRDECLSPEWCRHRIDATHVIEQWRRHYNEVRPHSSLGDQTPAEFKRQLPIPGSCMPGTAESAVLL